MEGVIIYGDLCHSCVGGAKLGNLGFDDIFSVEVWVCVVWVKWLGCVIWCLRYGGTSGTVGMFLEC